jgi:cation diffusion facilitator CzcD-associated flavoprotein CzcO/acetyl esterase/lipase
MIAVAQGGAPPMAIEHYPPRGALETVVAALLRTLLRSLLKPVFSARVPIGLQRRWLRALSRVSLVPRGASFEPAVVGGVPGEWVRPRERPSRPGTLLYLHGGAYCVGAAATHRALTARLARGTGMALFAADYRLAPEHPFPAAVDDAVAVYRALQADGPVVVAGDSAGGGLALALTLALRDAGLALPASLLLLSPWADMTMDGAPAHEPLGEAMLSVSWARACAALCLRDTPATHPWASPLKADLRGLPPVLIQAGTDELLHGQALQLHAALQAAAVPVRCEITPHRWHVFQLHGGALASADDAIARLALFATSAHAATDIETRDVVILGAGMSGLCMSVQLRRAGIEDFVVIEQSAGLGGTWWDNRYPGAHVDMPAPLYAFSFAPSRRWTRRFAAAAEIQAYMQDVAQRFGVMPHVRFGQRITSAHFDDADGHWRITTDAGRTLRARHFVCSTGPLSRPRLPDIPGIESFAGRVLHSARWDPTFDAAGRRIGVIGTGSTASQLVPPLAERAAQLTVFQRTANWVLPRLDRRYVALDRWLAHLPPYAKAVRALWYAFLEWGRRGFDEGTLARRGMLRSAELLLSRQVGDEALRARLRPPYPLGCKRIIYSNDYYRALARPNAALVSEGIVRVTPHGIVTADGREHGIDVLVCATGFDVEHSLAHLDIRGRAGAPLAQAWRDGPQAHLGLTVAGFPNLWLMLGPNTATGHTSTLLFIEPGVQWAVQAMQEVRRRGARWMAVKADVMQASNAALQARLGHSVWAACRSWYRRADGRIFALYPGFTREYVTAVRAQDFRDFEFG